jgi:hypothetical protein
MTEHVRPPKTSSVDDSWQQIGDVAAAIILDLTECPPAVDDQGRAGWAEIIALQAHVQVSQLTAELSRCDVCDTCGAQPCINRSFCDICRLEDRIRRRPRKSRS